MTAHQEENNEKRPPRSLATALRLPLKESKSLFCGTLVQVVRRGRRLVQDAVGQQAGVLADETLDPVGDLGIVAQELLRVLAALAQALAVIGEPGAGLFDDAGLDA